VPELLTIDDALARIVENAQLLPVENVAVPAAMGRVVREPATAHVDLPPFPSSAMDGFAVRASETPGELPIAYRVAAGAPPPGPLPVGAAAGISTGGTVPAEADAVVPVEQAKRGCRLRGGSATGAGRHFCHLSAEERSVLDGLNHSGRRRDAKRW
jgi:molybdopterin biosynthesis enzyme